MTFTEWFDWLELKYLSNFPQTEVLFIRRFCELAWIASDLEATKSWIQDTNKVLSRYEKSAEPSV